MSSTSVYLSEGRAPSLVTAHLTHAEGDSLSDLQILNIVQAGFLLRDVQAMISSSNLFRTRNLLQRITGKSAKAIQRFSISHREIRLTAAQSSMAFQYAKVLELAAIIFGSQLEAEDWLVRPCRYLSGGVPFDMLDTALGFNLLVDYLERVRLGVYQ